LPPKEPLVRPSLPKVASIIRHLLCDDRLAITAETEFEALLGWDDMDLVRVVVEVECLFNLEFGLTEIDRLRTVGDLLQSAVSKQALAAA
jgi:acyl carrier protein